MSLRSALLLLPRLLLAVLAAAACAAGASGSVREQEMAQCLPQEMATWSDGDDRPANMSSLLLAVQHDGAPPWFSAAQVLDAVDRAAQAWAACGIDVRVQALPSGAAAPAGAVWVLWSNVRSAGNFGLADLRARTLALSPAAFRLLATRNPTHPALDTLQMVLSHELGHFFGLMAHSRRCVDVMSYYDNGKGETCFTRNGRMPVGATDYRALLPTACDIARCRAVNGRAPLRFAP